MGESKVLVMDDEEIMRQTLEVVLTELGYETATVADGAKAVETYRQAMVAGRPFDAVILDLTVPGGMGGKEAIQRLRQIDPGVRAIVSSGYSDDPIMAEYPQYGFRGVVAKPYTVEELSRVLHQVITEPSQ